MRQVERPRGRLRLAPDDHSGTLRWTDGGHRDIRKAPAEGPVCLATPGFRSGGGPTPHTSTMEGAGHYDAGYPDIPGYRQWDPALRREDHTGVAGQGPCHHDHHDTMTAGVRQLRRTQNNDAPNRQDPAAPVGDYCDCGRGLAIGAVSTTHTRMVFHPLGVGIANSHENAEQLRCLDCVADTAADLASGKTRAEMQIAVAERRAELQALAARSQISVAVPPRQTSPVKGDRIGST